MADHGNPSDRARARGPSARAERWLQDHGDALYRFARARVRRSEVAEDLVQETLLAALSSRGRFEGRAEVRTWLLSILKRKVIDHYRRAASGSRREEESDRDADPAGAGEGPRDRGPARRRAFREDGSFREPPSPWKPPPEALVDREFWEVLDGCLDRLPEALASAFILREIDQVPVEEIRRTLDLSPGNLRLRLYRARLLLRDCLERRWLRTDPPEPPDDSR